MCSGSRSFSPKRAEARFWAASLLVLGLLVGAALRLVPPPPPPSIPLRPVDVPGTVVPVTFVIPGRLNVNRATAAELEKLPGIGPTLAARIVAYRTEHGPFRAVDELVRVPGIGPKTLEGLRDLVTVEDEERVIVPVP